MITFRVERERRGYFLARLPEWLAGFSLFMLGVQLMRPGNSFALSKIYTILERMAPERTWAMVALTISTARLVSLLLNGFFPVIRRITPIVRCVTAYLGGCVWFALAIGFIQYNSSVPGIVAHLGWALMDFVYASMIACEAAHVAKGGFNAARRR